MTAAAPPTVELEVECGDGGLSDWVAAGTGLAYSGQVEQGQAQDDRPQNTVSFMVDADRLLNHLRRLPGW
ncbi:hypothetical protein [Azospirillum thermophilum]|uniref:Uncharacterized protein n=1 Tax=Azospirillum thermophilum TaxID=2202148 RepID=A0A2S2D0F9_9PROT|nr:hypothetical protein [Azospirillum thermophilum]AWK90185.1 hypothetical protein DEW08_29675 [Azospirillum thermophilum]